MSQGSHNVESNRFYALALRLPGSLSTMHFLFILLAAFLLGGCRASTEQNVADNPSRNMEQDSSSVLTGARVLVQNGFSQLQGERVGLVVNHTAKVDSVHLIDLIHQAPEVQLGALFGPEHGLRGTAGAGEKVGSGRDPKTGVPIYSLYGELRKPRAEMLEGLDALIFDIQDIGARFYTYITTLGLTMQAAAEADIPFIVLDRPNPLGGQEVAGFVLDEQHESFVGRYPIPIQYGLTVGELARLIQEEDLMEGLDSLDLSVVPIENWQRTMLWPETGLPWIAPSPNIPDFETALVYPGAAFFEATAASEGRGTDHPFKLIGAPWANGQALADSLNARDLPGVRFEAAQFTPRSIPGASPNPKLEGQQLEGIRHVITDASAFRPVATGVHVLHAFYQQAPSKEQFITRPEWLAKLSGSEQLYEMLQAGYPPRRIVASWEDAVQAFREKRQPYLLYEE